MRYLLPYGTRNKSKLYKLYVNGSALAKMERKRSLRETRTFQFRKKLTNGNLLKVYKIKYVSENVDKKAFSCEGAQ